MAPTTVRPDLRENPEESLLRHESQQEPRAPVDRIFLTEPARQRAQQDQTAQPDGWVFYNCYYLSTDRNTIGSCHHWVFSDSLVSDYRRRIEQELRLVVYRG